MGYRGKVGERERARELRAQAWTISEIVDESRLRVPLYLHQGLDLDGASSFWSALTGIPSTQFGTPYRAVPDPSIRCAKHPLGCPAVSYASSITHREIMGLVHALLRCEVCNPG